MDRYHVEGTARKQEEEVVRCQPSQGLEWDAEHTKEHMEEYRSVKYIRELAPLSSVEDT
jgi:hypothetical protein